MPSGRFAEDLSGKTFGRLVVIGREPNKGSEAFWLCGCVCGAKTIVKGGSLRSGRTQTCGCLRGEVASQEHATHGFARVGQKTPEYKIWNGIVDRCTRPTAPFYLDYGGRGVTICDEWRHDFPAFLGHIGPRPSSKHSVDRIDNNRGYEPGNVRWATMKEQCANRRSRDRVAADRAEAALAIARAENERLRAALRLIVEGRARIDVKHPVSPEHSMAGRFIMIARNALAGQSEGDLP